MSFSSADVTPVVTASEYDRTEGDVFVVSSSSDIVVVVVVVVVTSLLLLLLLLLLLAAVTAVAVVLGRVEEDELVFWLFFLADFLSSLVPSFHAGFVLFDVDDVVGTITFFKPFVPYAFSNADTRSRRRRAAGSHDFDRSRLEPDVVFRNI